MGLRERSGIKKRSGRRKRGRKLIRVQRVVTTTQTTSNDPRVQKKQELEAKRDRLYTELDKEHIKTEDKVLSWIKKRDNAQTAKERNAWRRFIQRGGQNLKAIADKKDRIRRDFHEEIRTIDRAIKKGITIQAQKRNEKENRRRSVSTAQADANQQAFIASQTQQAWNQASPEARKRIRTGYGSDLRKSKQRNIIVDNVIGTDIRTIANSFDNAKDFLKQLQRNEERGIKQYYTRDPQWAKKKYERELKKYREDLKEYQKYQKERQNFENYIKGMQQWTNKKKELIYYNKPKVYREIQDGLTYGNESISNSSRNWTIPSTSPYFYNSSGALSNNQETVNLGYGINITEKDIRRIQEEKAKLEAQGVQVTPQLIKDTVKGLGKGAINYLDSVATGTWKIIYNTNNPDGIEPTRRTNFLDIIGINTKKYDNKKEQIHNKYYSDNLFLDRDVHNAGIFWAGGALFGKLASAPAWIRYPTYIGAGGYGLYGATRAPVLSEYLGEYIVTGPGQGKRIYESIKSMPKILKAFRGDYYRAFEIDPVKSYSMADYSIVANPKVPLRLKREAIKSLQDIYWQGKPPEKIILPTRTLGEKKVNVFLARNNHRLALGGSRNLYSSMPAGKEIWYPTNKDFDIKVLRGEGYEWAYKTNRELFGGKGKINGKQTGIGTVWTVEGYINKKKVSLDFAESNVPTVLSRDGIRLVDRKYEIDRKWLTAVDATTTVGRRKDLEKLAEQLRAQGLNPKNYLFKQNIAYHSGRIFPFMEGNTFTGKQITPSRWETISGQAGEPITFFGQNEMITFFKKGSTNVMRLTDDTVKFLRVKDLPKAFQKPARTTKGAIQQTKAYLAWIKKSGNEGNIVPSPQTITSRDFRGFPTTRPEKEWIVLGKIEGLNHYGISLNPHGFLTDRINTIVSNAPRRQQQTLKQKLRILNEDIKQNRILQEKIKKTPESQLSKTEKAFKQKQIAYDSLKKMRRIKRITRKYLKPIRRKTTRITNKRTPKRRRTPIRTPRKPPRKPPRRPRGPPRTPRGPPRPPRRPREPPRRAFPPRTPTIRIPPRRPTKKEQKKIKRRKREQIIKGWLALTGSEGTHTPKLAFKTREEAEGYARDYVDKTADTSYQLKKISRIDPKRLKTWEKTQRGLSHKFEKKKNTYHEKKSYQGDSRGEFLMKALKA